jgi:hypothetical protein
MDPLTRQTGKRRPQWNVFRTRYVVMSPKISPAAQPQHRMSTMRYTDLNSVCAASAAWIWTGVVECPRPRRGRHAGGGVGSPLGDQRDRISPQRVPPDRSPPNGTERSTDDTSGPSQVNPRFTMADVRVALRAPGAAGIAAAIEPAC